MADNAAGTNSGSAANNSNQALLILVPVMTTLISVVGSFGTAWLTTGAKFERELASKGEQIAALEQAQQQSTQLLSEARAGLAALEQKLAELTERRQTLSGSLADVDKRLTAVDQRFVAIREQNLTLNQQLEASELKLQSLKRSGLIKEQSLVRP